MGLYLVQFYNEFNYSKIIGPDLPDNLKKTLLDKIQLYSNRATEISNKFQQQTQQLTSDLQLLEQNNNAKLLHDSLSVQDKLLEERFQKLKTRPTPANDP